MGRRHRDAAAGKHLHQQLSYGLVCTICGERLGKHRFGTDQCPNTAWKPGNGREQWLGTSFTDDPLSALRFPQEVS